MTVPELEGRSGEGRGEVAARVLRGPAAPAKPGPPSRWEWESAWATHGAGQRLSLLPASARNVCDTALPRGREREAADGPERRARPGIPHRQRSRPAARGRRGLTGCSWPAVFLAVGLDPAGGQFPICFVRGCAQPFSSCRWLGLSRGPEVRLALPPTPVSLGSSWDLRRVRQARRPGGSRSSQGRCRPSPSPPGWPRGGAWRWQESGPSSGLGGGGVGAVM